MTTWRARWLRGTYGGVATELVRSGGASRAEVRAAFLDAPTAAKEGARRFVPEAIPVMGQMGQSTSPLEEQRGLHEQATAR